MPSTPFERADARLPRRLGALARRLPIAAPWSRRAPIPVILAIDIEPDERLCDPARPRPWSGFERCLPVFASLRERLSRVTGAPVRFSWFVRMDPQVEVTYGTSLFVAERYGRELARLVAAGDELGLHVHAWHWSEPLRIFVSDLGDAAWVAHCVRSSFAAFETAFGRPCRSFRFGDRWHDSSQLPLLRELGVVVDLTLEPGRPAVTGLSARERSTGMIPATLGAPAHPYRPGHAWLSEGSSEGEGPWMLPLTTGRPSPLATEVLSLGYSLRPRAFRSIARRALRAPRPYLAGAVRSDLPGTPDMPSFMRNMEWLASHPERRRFRFTPPEEALALLTGPTS
jgi:hypothetical protein